MEFAEIYFYRKIWGGNFSSRSNCELQVMVMWLLSALTDLITIALFPHNFSYPKLLPSHIFFSFTQSDSVTIIPVFFSLLASWTGWSSYLGLTVVSTKYGFSKRLVTWPNLDRLTKRFKPQNQHCSPSQSLDTADLFKKKLSSKNSAQFRFTFSLCSFWKYFSNKDSYFHSKRKSSCSQANTLREFSCPNLLFPIIIYKQV